MTGGSAPLSTGGQLAALGPYFTADSHDLSGAHEPSAAVGAAGDPWRPMSELLDDPDVMSRRVGAVRAYLAAAGGTARTAGGTDRPEQLRNSVELRVAASVTHLGLAARTLSPLLALTVTGRAPAFPIGIRDLRWQPTLGSTFPLSIPDLDRSDLDLPDRPASASASSSTRPSTSAAMDLAPLSAELCAAVEPFGVSPRVLWGNIASALNGARIALSSADPGLAVGAAAEVGRLLSTPPLAGTSRTRPDGSFQRLSCCLIYRAAPDRRGPLCGDCILAGR